MLQLVVELATSDVDVIGETRDLVDAGGVIGEAAAGRLGVDAVQKGSDGPQRIGALAEPVELRVASVATGASGQSGLCQQRLPPARRETGSCLLYTSPSPRDATLSRMPSSA